MNLFVLIADKEGPGRRFLEQAAALIPPEKLEVFDGPAGFAERLRRPHDPSFAVLVVGPSHDDLRRIVSLRDFIKDGKVLLALDDQSEATIALAHRTLPTYICDLENSTDGLVSVLRQLMKDTRGDPV